MDHVPTRTRTTCETAGVTEAAQYSSQTLTVHLWYNLTNRNTKQRLNVLLKYSTTKNTRDMKGWERKRRSRKENLEKVLFLKYTLTQK